MPHLQASWGEPSRQKQVLFIGDVEDKEHFLARIDALRVFPYEDNLVSPFLDCVPRKSQDWTVETRTDFHCITELFCSFLPRECFLRKRSKKYDETTTKESVPG